MIVAQRITNSLGFLLCNKGNNMSKMKDFILDIDYLINVQKMSVAEIATIMGCTESMVEDAICIIRDAFDETLQ